MIPTSSKAKLPSDFSYPIGAEVISEALAGTPHVGAFSVWFGNGTGGLSTKPLSAVEFRSASEFRRLLVDRRPYAIMAAWYQPKSKPRIGVDAFFGRERWGLTVYPVLAELKHLASRLLREEGLPTIATWLKSSDRAGWNANWHRIELEFSPADGSLAASESNGV